MSTKVTGIKPAGKFIIFGMILAGCAFGGYRWWQGNGARFMPDAETRGSVVPRQADLPPGIGEGSGSNKPVTLPGTSPASLSTPEVRFLHWAWNAQMGMMFATGGTQTAEGSLMAKNGVNMKLIRQDDVTKMQEELITFARALDKGEKQPAVGAHFVAIMGDGSATFLTGVNEVLRRIGPEYSAKVVGVIGFSRGEDKFMGPKGWKDNPRSAMGGVVSGYLRDGDWNIAQKWLGDNSLRNNPDEKTYDPDALNWVAANDYLDACEKYITGYTETRPVVRNGRKTGEVKRIKVDGVVTWTPGDVNIAQQKGGLISIVSTKEYASQMPCTIIGIDKWMRGNRGTVEKMLDAMYQGADAVRSSDEALDAAAKVSDMAYGESSTGPEYWKKYYKGTVERDKQGLMVELGGSSVCNLADNLLVFGLTAGSQNLFAATYTVFGNIVKDQYPDLVPSIDPVGQILDTSYVQALAKRSAPTTSEIAAAKPSGFEKTGSVKRDKIISRKAWQIQFNTGNAAFTASAGKTLNRLLQDLLIANDTVVEIYGHTDNVGDASKNMALSEARAFAVKSWLEKRSPVNFPKGRIRVFAMGQTNPIAPNSSNDGRAKNRRVEIVMGARN